MYKINSEIRKEKTYKLNNLTIHLRKLEKEVQFKTQAKRWKGCNTNETKSIKLKTENQ